MVNLNDLFGTVQVNNENNTQEGGRRKARKPRSASPSRKAKASKPVKKTGKKTGKKGGVDLTPFLTSLLLIGSRMAYDKKNPRSAFKNVLSSAKTGKKSSNRMRRGGADSESVVQVENPFKDSVQDPLANPAELVSQGTSQGTSQSGGNNNKNVLEYNTEGGARRHRKTVRKSAPKKAPKSPRKTVRKTARKPHKAS